MTSVKRLITPAMLSNVSEFFSRRHVGLTEPRKVRRDHTKSVSEQRDQITKHVARAREAVEQQQLRCVGWSSLAIENIETIDIGRAISDRRHEKPSSVFATLLLRLRRVIG
jgi:hypothetical protein